MSTESKTTHKVTHKDVQDTLHSVIESLIDGQEGFQKIGEHLKDETLRRYFAAESLKRASFRGELETMLHTEGDHDPKQSGSVSGTVRRTWGDLSGPIEECPTNIFFDQPANSYLQWGYTGNLTDFYDETLRHWQRAGRAGSSSIMRKS